MGQIQRGAGSPRYRRFEAYKVATTIGGARRLGSSSQDISMDVAAGALVLLRATDEVPVRIRMEKT